MSAEETYNGMKVRELKEILAGRGIDFTGICEKAELVALAVKSMPKELREEQQTLRPESAPVPAPAPVARAPEPAARQAEPEVDVPAPPRSFAPPPPVSAKPGWAPPPPVTAKPGFAPPPPVTVKPGWTAPPPVQPRPAAPPAEAAPARAPQPQAAVPAPPKPADSPSPPGSPRGRGGAGVRGRGSPRGGRGRGRGGRSGSGSDSDSGSGSGRGAAAGRGRGGPADRGRGMGRGVVLGQKRKFFVEEPSNTSVYITGLPKDVQEGELVELFATCGAIRKDNRTGAKAIKIYRDPDFFCKGDAVIAFKGGRAAVEAITQLDGCQMRPGVVISVQYAHSKEKTAKKPRLAEPSPFIRRVGGGAGFGDFGRDEEF